MVSGNIFTLYKVTMRFLLLSVFAAFYAAGCFATTVPAPVVSDDALAKTAKDSVLTQLDEKAKTAEFRNIHVHTWHKRTVYLTEDEQKNGYRAVCGEVRYKDENSALTPYIRFIYISQDSTIGVTSQDWAENCVD